MYFNCVAVCVRRTKFLETVKFLQEYNNLTTWKSYKNYLILNMYSFMIPNNHFGFIEVVSIQFCTDIHKLKYYQIPKVKYCNKAACIISTIVCLSTYVVI